MSNNKSKVLIISLSGIGNFLMQSPVWQNIKKARPDWHISAWVAPRGTKELALADASIDQVIEAPIKTSLYNHFKLIKQLRRENYDIGLVLHPGQLIKSAFYLYAASIPRRIGHTYPLGKKKASGFLLTNALKIDKTLHDTKQNLRLLEPLDISNYPAAAGPRHGGGQIPIIPPQRDPATAVAKYILSIPANHTLQAKSLIDNLNLPDSTPLIGFHPGSATNFIWKRWPKANFATVARQLIRKRHAHILIFGGSQEEKLKEQLRKEITKKLPVTPPQRDPATAVASYHLPVTSINTDLLTTAALMKSCHLVVANDSGLMHLSAATGTATLGLFGPTDEHLTGPLGQNSFTIRAAGSSPVYDTNTNYQLGSISHPTMKALKPSEVLDKISRIWPR